MRAKREPEKHPLLSRRGRHEKGAARPFQTPKELSKHKNASRFAKRIFCTSPVYGSADGVTFSQNFTFCKGVKSAAKQQMGKSATATTAACGGYREELLGQRPAGCERQRSRRWEPQPVGSRASKVAGAFLVLFWHAKENLALPQQRSIPRHQRVIPLRNAPQSPLRSHRAS